MIDMGMLLCASSLLGWSTRDSKGRDGRSDGGMTTEGALLDGMGRVFGGVPNCSYLMQGILRRRM